MENEEQKDLPKPPTDLPLPRLQMPEQSNGGQAEKEITAHAGENTGRKFPFPKYIFLGIVFVVLLLIAGAAVLGGKYYLNQQKLKAITDFETCASAGYPVAESYPATCRTPDGRSFTQVLSEEEQKNLDLQSSTADWKTYNGNNFSFRYPADGYEASVTNESEYSSQNNIDIKNGIKQSMKVSAPILVEATDVNVIVPSGSISAHKTNFSVWIFKNPDNLTASEWYQKYWYYPFNWGEAIKSEVEKNAPKNKILVDVKSGGYITQDSMGRVQHILVPVGNQMYLFEVLGENGDETVGNQILSTFKFTDPSSTQNNGFLEIPQFGVKIPLTQNIADAYSLPETASKGYIYLRVRSLDLEPACKKDSSSTAAIAKQDIKGPFPFDLTYQEFRKRFPGVEIENFYYYINLAQYACAESSNGTKLLEKVREEFSSASENIKKL